MVDRIGRRLLQHILGAGAILLAGAAAAGDIETTTTPGSGNQSFNTRYPAYAAAQGCAACHNGPPGLNTTYGPAYKAAILALPGGRIQSNVGPALANIEPADSDGDGYSNIIEINAGRKAHDASDHPTAGASTFTNPTTKEGNPSTTVTYLVTLTNTGDIPDSFTLGVSVTSGQAWTTTITGSANNLAPSGSVSVVVNVAIPGAATGGQSSTATLTATSQANPSVSATPLNLTTSIPLTGPRFVDAATGTDAADCRSPANPCKTIHYAMLKAAPGNPGDTITVAPGTYNAALGEIFPITLKAGVRLVSSGSAANTIIDGPNSAGAMLRLTGGNASTLVRGFTFTRGGTATTSGANPDGGAIFISGGDQTTIEQNTFSGNAVVGNWNGSMSNARGGAIYSSGATALIRNNVFVSNVARGVDGNPTGVTGNTMQGGTGLGGAIYADGGTIVNNTFYGNQARGGYNGGSADAGAIFATGSSVVNNIFAANSSVGVTTALNAFPGTDGIHGALNATGGTVFNNLFFANITGTSPSTGDTVGTNAVVGQDPLFHSPPSNLRIAMASPANGAGTSGGAPAIDFDGITRPDPPAIGAFEASGFEGGITDLNADGKSDVLYRNATSGQVYRMLMNGFTIVDGAMVFAEPNTAWKIVRDGDFNGDGATDLLWRNGTTGEVFYQPFDTNGRPMPGSVIYAEPNAAWRIVATPDLDGDGRDDILWWNSATGQVYAMLMNGTTIVAQGSIMTEPNTSWQIVAAGDFAGSGKQNQLLWRNESSGLVYLMTVTYSGGVFSQAGQLIYSEPDTAWKVIGAPDLDGDGRSDILWRNDVTGQVFGMLMNGATIASQAMIYTEPNLAWKIVAQGDYNGDGKADIVYRNDTTGQVYMILMNGLATGSAAMVYSEPNTAWRLLGPWEYAQ